LDETPLQLTGIVVDKVDDAIDAAVGSLLLNPFDRLGFGEGKRLPLKLIAVRLFRHASRGS
jgi:hypothetical protein